MATPRDRRRAGRRGALAFAFALLSASPLELGGCSRSVPGASESPPVATPEVEGAELLGTAAPPWQVTDWLNSPPLSLEGLRGKVVLVRWWTDPSCPYCSATAPSLRALDDELRDRGLVVIGFYHHKGSGPLDPAVYTDAARRYGFRFPIAIDPEWRTLEAWWLHGRNRDWTSVSFVLDRRGTIRFIHPGGAYAPGSVDYARIHAAVTALLAEGS